MNRTTHRQHPSLRAFLEAIKDEPRMSREEADSVPISNEELQKHNTPRDAWVSFRGYVYDVTKYVNYHPGGMGCFATYFGYDITQVVAAVHSRVDVSQFITAVLRGRLDGDPVVPPTKRLQNERGQL